MIDWFSSVVGGYDSKKIINLSISGQRVSFGISDNSSFEEVVSDEEISEKKEETKIDNSILTKSDFLTYGAIFMVGLLASYVLIHKNK